jgi:rhodanese-related sulfurtransferase
MALAGALKTLGPKELAERLNDANEIRVVDVRSPVEYESAHIAGSHNLPLDLLPPHAATLGERADTPLVLVCRSGQRARQAQDILHSADLHDVQVLEGGLAAWERAGLPVERGRQVWSLERQIRAIAGTLVLIGTLGSLFVWPPLIFLAMFVGAGLLFAGVSDICMMGMLLSKLPYNRRPEHDTRKVVEDLLAGPART